MKALQKKLNLQVLVETWLPEVDGGRSHKALVFVVLMAKFTQNEQLRKQLLSTGDAILAECSPRDRIWGIGISLTDERRLDPDLWRGKNLLGYVLMEVREQLKQ